MMLVPGSPATQLTGTTIALDIAGCLLLLATEGDEEAVVDPATLIARWAVPFPTARGTHQCRALDEHVPVVRQPRQLGHSDIEISTERDENRIEFGIVCLSPNISERGLGFVECAIGHRAVIELVTPIAR